MMFFILVLVKNIKKKELPKYIPATLKLHFKYQI